MCTGHVDSEYRVALVDHPHTPVSALTKNTSPLENRAVSQAMAHMLWWIWFSVPHDYNTVSHLPCFYPKKKCEEKGGRGVGGLGTRHHCESSKTLF